MVHDTLSFRQIVEASQDVVWTLDPREMTFSYVSPSVERLLGWTPAELVGGPASAVLRPDDLETIRRLVVLLLERPPATSFSRTREFDQPHKDGHLVPTEVVTTVLLDAAGRFTEVLGVSRDITERRRAEADRRALEGRLLQTRKLESLAVLAGGVAHEFNNLLTSVLGHADLAIQDLPAGSPIAGSLFAIEKAARRAATISQHLLAYSGRGRFVVGALAVSDVVRDMSRMLELAVENGAVLEFALADGLPCVDADEEQLRLLVTNLVSNAADALGERSGTIRVATSLVECTPPHPVLDFLGQPLPHGAYLLLEVSDDGAGMDDETKSRVFDPFFSTKFMGRGLGLPAVLGVVRGHRGAIDVDTQPGHGTTVRVYLPTLAKGSGDCQRRAAVRPEPALGTVLVVDDEDGVRKVALRMVERCGFAAVGAVDGQDAVDRVREDPARFRCVLMDLTMPRMGGVDALQAIRALTATIPVVICSGYTTQELTERFTGLGVTGFLQKPFRLTEIRDRLQMLLGLP